jgi:hypothetical protein
VVATPRISAARQPLRSIAQGPQNQIKAKNHSHFEPFGHRFHRARRRAARKKGLRMRALQAGAAVSCGDR